MIKRSAILVLVFMLGSVFLLLCASTKPTDNATASAGKCVNKAANMYWNMATPSFFQLKVN